MRVEEGHLPFIIEENHLSLEYHPHFYSFQEQDRIFQQLYDQIEWQQKSIFLFGKSVKEPRLTAWFGEPQAVYVYSNLRNDPLPWNDPLLKIRFDLEQRLDCSFNSVLANLYRNGVDSMGWHSDDEPELGVNPVIASVSFGECRAFHLRHRHNQQIQNMKIWIAPGSVLIMKGKTQQFWQHSLPKTKTKPQPRINLSFRNFEREIST